MNSFIVNFNATTRHTGFVVVQIADRIIKIFNTQNVSAT